MSDIHRVALVTGASRGIGRACVIALAQPKMMLYVNDVANFDQAAETCEQARAQGAQAEVLGFNVADPADVTAAVDTIVKSQGRLDILVNNAGIARDNLIARLKEQDWDQVLNVNLKGAFNCIKAATRPMMKQRWGRIISLSSVVAFMGNPGQANYAASKAGLVGLTKAAARELASRQITVNAIAPGFIATDMTAGLPEKIQADMLAQIPLNRFGAPEEVAAVVAFLASEAAGYITGEVIHINGGLIMA
ncbi:3-oxoacyl-[acyl-carrier-protein] reductase [Desulfobacca acetoxidans]|nr:3-oxoacyl-[acyl-carrier-protein] reductase [Desulfobacterales bacterium]